MSKASKLFLLDERRNSSANVRVSHPVDHAGGRSVITDPLCNVGCSSYTTGADVALSTWVSMLQDEAGLVEPVGVVLPEVQTGCKFLIPFFCHP